VVTDRVQLAVVRLLHDPPLVARVYAGEDLPGLSPKEMAWLRAPDPRAWTADVARPGRVLHALVGEFPVAVAERGAEGLAGFFSHPAWVDALGAGRPLAWAFGSWLGDRPYARLETAFAHARRGDGETGRPPGVWLVEVPAGTLAAWTTHRGRLDTEAVLAGARVRSPRGGREHVLVQGTDASVVPADLAAVLRASDPAREARRRGATPEEARALVEELARDGVIPAPPPRPSPP